MPSPRVVLVLSLAVFCTGFLLGAMAGPSAPNGYAAAGGPVNTIIVVSPPAAPAAAAPPTPPPAVTQAPEVTPPPPVPLAPAEPAAVTEEPAAEPAAGEQEQPAEDPEPEQQPAAEPKLPPVKHVWLVVMSRQGLQDAFGPDSHSVLLRQTLPPKGLLLLDHHAVGSGPGPNALALLAGVSVQGDYDGPSLPDQLTSAGLTWKGYVEGVGPEPCRDRSNPRNPFPLLTQVAQAPECATNVAPLEQLQRDLDSGDPPNLSYVVPDACHDGRDEPCAPGAISGTAAADAWLRSTLRAIRATPVYKQDGMIIVTFDEGREDDHVGTLLLSRFVSAGTTLDARTDHRTILKTLEDLFGLDHLAAVDGEDVTALGSQDLHASATTR